MSVTPPMLWVAGNAQAEAMAVELGATAGPIGSVHTTVVNDTELPDAQVQAAVAQYMTDVYFAENASLAGAQSTFQTYVNDGSLLARHRWRTPQNVIEEMKLARDIAERDDDVRAVIGGVIALAFDHIEHHSRDHRAIEIVNKLAGPKRMNLRHMLGEMYREYLITSSVTTVKVLTPVQISVAQDSADHEYDAAPTLLPMRMLCPRFGVLPGENIRVVGSDLLGDRVLAYWPGDDPKLSKFLREFFSDSTSAARRNRMKKEDPISTALFLSEIKVADQQAFIPGQSFYAYELNPAMAWRTTMGKGFWPYPRPLLAACFPLLEAKRLLNIMDFALLQGAANYIVVAKKGSDLKPAQPAELAQLRELVRHVGRTGVLVGDHRLSFEILTPQLNDLLAADKRELIARRIVSTLLRKPESITQDAGAQGAATEIEWISRVIEADRSELIAHVEADIYETMVEANPTVFKATPKIWCPKIILQGTQFFTDLIIKLRDRGDIPRKYAIEAAGFSFEAAVSERQWEQDAGIDDILVPAAVPYTVPAGVPDPTVGPEGNKGPQDNNSGRPQGSRTGVGADPRAPKRTISRNAGETVKAWREEGMERPYRMGEQTRAVLALYSDTAEVGRLTTIERKALATGKLHSEGPITIVPVNPGTTLGDLKVVRLHKEGASLYLGTLPNGGVIARALGFRAPEYDALGAQEAAMAWGFAIDDEAQDED